MLGAEPGRLQLGPVSHLAEVGTGRAVPVMGERWEDGSGRPEGILEASGGLWAWGPGREGALEAEAAGGGLPFRCLGSGPGHTEAE